MKKKKKSLSEAMMYEHENPPPPFNSDYNPNWEKVRKLVREEMERLEEISPCSNRSERAIRWKETYDRISKEV